MATTTFIFLLTFKMRELVEMADLVRHNDETIVKIREKLWEDYFLAVDNSKRSLQRRISIGRTEDLATVYVITVEWEEELELALATINTVVEMFLDD